MLVVSLQHMILNRVKIDGCGQGTVGDMYGVMLDRDAGPRSAVGNVSGYRCVSDCRSRGREFDPSPVPYFRGD